MRILLHTGAGGSGRTTVAAATAVAAASCGYRTLLLQADAPAFDASVDSLRTARIDTAATIAELWPDVRAHLAGALGVADLTHVGPEELPLPPGAAHLATMLAIARSAGDVDVLVVDCEPAATVEQLLALPEVVRFYLERLMSTPVRLVRAGAAGLPDAIGRLLDELDAARNLLTDSAVTTVSLVLIPDRRAVAAGRRTVTVLALHGVPVARVVVNRLLPDLPELSPWRTRQDAALASVTDSFGGLAQGTSIRTVMTAVEEPTDAAGLLDLADQLFDGADPTAAPVQSRPEPAHGLFTLVLPLPFAERGDLELVRAGDDLVLTVGSARRRISLPPTLRRCRTCGARFADGELVIDFVPDPGQWPAALWAGLPGTDLAGVG